MTDKSRTLTYRRATWARGRHSLYRLIVDAADLRSTQASRTFVHQEGEISALELVVDRAGLFGHIAAYVPGRPTSIVPVPSRARRVEAEQHAAPDSFNFSEGDLFFLLHGNHLVLCSSGAREGACLAFLRQMLVHSGQEALVPMLTLDPVADVDRVRLLRDEGVKKVMLGASLYQATVDYQERRTMKQSVMNSVAEQFLAFFGTDRRLDIDPADYENLSVKIELTFDGRKVVTQATTRQLERTANSLVADGDDGEFSIITGEGKKLTADTVRVNKPLTLPAFGNSVSKPAAYEALTQFLAELRHAGTLAQ